MPTYEETTTNIPYGLITCLWCGRELSVTELSRRHVVVRLCESPAEVSEEASFYIYGEDGKPRLIGPYRASVTQRDGTLEFDSPSFAHEVDELMKRYMRFIRLRSEGDVISAERPEGCDEFARSYADRLGALTDSSGRGRLADVLADELLKVRGKASIALSLENGRLLRAFTSGTLDELLPKALRGTYDTLYIGNAFCPRLFPDMDALDKIARRAADEGKKLVLVTSFIAGEPSDLRGCVEKVMEYGLTPEIEINDWGYLACVSGPVGECRLSLGRLLNRCQKDPRREFIVNGRLNNCESPRYSEKLLKRLGLSGTEEETPGYRVNVCHSSALHLPFYQTNTSKLCPLEALVRRGDRSRQVSGCREGCGELCESHVAMYPSDYKLIGRYNSLFGVDDGAGWQNGLLEEYIARGVRRLVWNLW